MGTCSRLPCKIRGKWFKLEYMFFTASKHMQTYKEESKLEALMLESI